MHENDMKILVTDIREFMPDCVAVQSSSGAKNMEVGIPF
jgi:hypothetical protein